MRVLALHSYLLWPYGTGGERTTLDVLASLTRAGVETRCRYAIPPGMPAHAVASFRAVIHRFGFPLCAEGPRLVRFMVEGVAVEAVAVDAPPATWVGAWLDEIAPDVILVQAKDILLLPAVAALWRGKGFLFVQDLDALTSLQRMLTPASLARIAASTLVPVATSRFLQARAQRVGLNPRLLYPCLTLPSSAPPDPSSPVTSVGTTPEKGFDLVRTLASRMVDVPFRIILCWNDTPPEEAGPNVSFAPFSLDPSPLYRASRAVLVPSRSPEGFGRVAHEAMACGRVPIVSDRGALPEVVGEAGIVVPFEDDDAWDRAIRRLGLEDLEVRATACRRRAEALTRESRGQFEAVFGVSFPA